MSNKQKKSLVPEVRFPEFSDNGSWSRKKIGSALRLTLREKNKPSENYTGLGVRSHGKGTFLKYKEDPKKNAMNVLYEVHKDDLVVSITFAWEGALAIADQYNQGALVSHRFPTYVFNREVALPGFFKILILDKLFIYRLGVISPGGAGRNRVLNKKDFLKLEVALPLVEEQQKIADCLASIDELITLHTQKLNALKDHKNGLMQQLFPVKGETVPKLRFPEFSGKGKWEFIPLGHLLSLNPDYGVNAPAVPYSDKLPTYVRITDISEDGRFIGAPKVSVDVEPTDDKYYLKPDDIVLARTGASVGKSYRYREEDGRLVFAGFLIRIRPDLKKVNSKFLSGFFSTQQYWSWVNITSTRSGQPGLNSTEYSALLIPIPQSELGLSEQHRIADFLESVDDLLHAQSKKIATLKEHKKGLIQKLFPVLDGVM